ncbi:MAG: MMPL family transporter, partial [Clostridia bacterium]|nr:MMPL family transporter [Clostridia bacterium]
GIAMDYAIFFMHTYNELRRETDAVSAAKRALPRILTTILASSLTTIGGFSALIFMEFEIGIDLAQVIIKGILMSLASVIFLQPALLIIFDKALRRTSHKPLHINVDRISRFSVAKRWIFMLAALLLIVPAYLAQNNVKFSYLKIYDQPETMNAQQKRAVKLGNQVITAVPLQTKTGGQSDYIAELLEDEKIGSVIGAYSAINMDEQALAGLLNVLVSEDSEDEMLRALSTLFRKVDGRWYTLYLIEIEGDTEDEDAFLTHSHLVNTTNKYFDENYPLGILTGVNDMANVTPRDFLRVTLVSIGIILLIMSLLLKSFRKSIIMVLLIELAIWLNISLHYVFGKSINFMVYIIISSVQLGCTVDYAILLSTRFEEMKQKYSDVKEAAARASASAFPAITTSVAMIFATCFTITLISENLLVKEMAWVLAKGAIISYIIVVTVLPGLLVFFKKIVPIKEEIQNISRHLKKKK